MPKPPRRRIARQPVKDRRLVLGEHLEWHGQQVRAVLTVAPSLRNLPSTGLPSKLRTPLGTGSPVEAERRKRIALADMERKLEEARRERDRTKTQHAGGFIREAMELRAWSEREKGRAALVEVFDEGGDGRVTVEDDIVATLIDDQAERVAERLGLRVGLAFADIASGRATPVAAVLDDWLLAYVGKTRAKYEANIKRFLGWCEREGIPATFEGVNAAHVKRYVTDTIDKGDKRAKTGRDYVSACQLLWGWWSPANERHAWAGARDLVRTMPAEKEARARAGGKTKRPFTDHEVAKLVAWLATAKDRKSDDDGITVQTVSDMAMIAALSGMRINEIAMLRVGDVSDNEGVFRVGVSFVGKTDAARRVVPIHPALRALARLRIEGREAGEFFIRELPDQTNDARGRAAPVSQRFTRYRRRADVDDLPDGFRQSRVDFHSFRRWFIRKSRDAVLSGAKGFDAWTIADTVGHVTADDGVKLELGQTKGYAGTDAARAARACVESVQLPGVRIPVGEDDGRGGVEATTV